MTALLEVEGLTVTYSGLRAVDDVTLEAQEGAVVGLIGPNGAGKTSLIDAVTGFASISAGEVRLRGERIDQLPPHKRARRGLARTFQSVELFDDLTVLENLLAATEHPGLLEISLDAVLPGRRRPDDRVRWALELAGVRELGERWPDELSTGERALVGVARALAGKPDLVLLDEPAAGLSTAASADLGSRLRSVAGAGVTVFLVDHDMGLVLSVCDWIYVLEFGVLIASGPPDAIRRDQRVITAYLGSTADSTESPLEPALEITGDTRA